MRITWPEGRTFAFTIFDDPDSQTCDGLTRVYELLADSGIRSTIGVWPSGPTRAVNSPGETCANAEYRRHVQQLNSLGFEVGYHNTTPHSSFRREIEDGLSAFTDYFGGDQLTMANHYNAEAIYWGEHRFGGVRRLVYRATTLGKKQEKFSGHVQTSPYFWGDLCKARVRYCRNFTFPEINTLAACPWMPYVDSQRPFVNSWFASSDGANIREFSQLLSEENQDRLEESGGACILYTHFGLGFVENGSVNRRFRDLVRRLTQKNGWFVPVRTLLSFLSSQRGPTVLSAEQRRLLEWRWLRGRLLRSFPGIT